MTKEIYHEGWLIKSPPTKRIWRARWRRRWFTLKQGELPEQFCLEYYKDRSCRKLKGVIDLDQCEQVDSGLQLEHRKQKFQYMFDVKTPLRTYYLAANSEEDMNAWVNCICYVCNLQDLSKPSLQINGGNCSQQYYNVTSELNDGRGAANSSSTTNLKTTNLPPVKPPNTRDQMMLLRTTVPIENNNSVYQNYDAMCRNSTYNNRETLICDVILNKNGSNDATESKVILNSNARKNSTNNCTEGGHSIGDRIAKQSLVRKIPEKLTLNGSIGADASTSRTTKNPSGPYIAISDCISGNPLTDRENPTTPLNSLDPRFYETPRSFMTHPVGLNLTNEQPYSPKRNNIPTILPHTPHSGKSSPTDSESVFTDDEEWMQTNPKDSAYGERCMRPSESSVENDSIVFTYAQRFSKMPDDDKSTSKRVNLAKPLPVAGLSLEKPDTEEQNKDTNSSDTENASPAIAFGPKDMNSYVDESYDIPRSHQLPYTKCTENTAEFNREPSEASVSILTLEEVSNSSGESIMPKKRSHFYTNAAPAKIEGNVFRYDFDDKQLDAPAVDRKLKPKLQLDDSETKSATLGIVKNPLLSKSSPNQPSIELKPPCIDRKLKPTTPVKLETSTLQRRGVLISAADSEFQGGYCEQVSKTLPRNYNNSSSLKANQTISGSAKVATSTTTIAQGATSRHAGVLEYFDLDHSNPPPICNSTNTSISTSNLHAQTTSVAWQTKNLSNRLSAVGVSSSVFGAPNASVDPNPGNNPTSIGSISTGVNNPATHSGIVYKSVDFIKTEAFMRTRQDAELSRAKNRSKE